MSKHEQLVEKAEQAINAVFVDNSVDKRTTRESLKDLNALKFYTDPKELAKTYPNVTMATIVCCKCFHQGRKLVCRKCGHHICTSCKEPN